MPPQRFYFRTLFTLIDFILLEFFKMKYVFIDLDSVVIDGKGILNLTSVGTVGTHHFFLAASSISLFQFQ